MSFKKLLADLAVVQKDVLAKSTAGDAADANIQQAGATGGDANDAAAGDSQAAGAAGGGAAAGGAEGGAEGGAAGGAEGGAAGGEGGTEEEGGAMVKSFEVTLDDGSKFQAVDAGEMIADLTKSLNTLEADAGQALGIAIDLIKSQQTQIDGLTAAVRKLASSGSGRQAVLSIVGKTSAADLTKGGHGAAGAGAGGSGDGEGAITAREFLVKSEQAFDKKAISGRELGLIETMVNRGEKIPVDLIKKVASAVSLTAAA